MMGFLERVPEIQTLSENFINSGRVRESARVKKIFRSGGMQTEQRERGTEITPKS